MLELFQIDAFADAAFSGNPAGVMFLERERPDDWMQKVAAEMNLSETAFLSLLPDGFGLRWFTPNQEVDLCGHATLASAHCLWETGRLDRNAEARFLTRSGWLTARCRGDRVEMDFPAVPETGGKVPDGLAEALGAPVVHAGMNRFDCLVETFSERDVRGASPDMARLRGFPIRGFILTSRASDPAFDFVSRFFAPAFGVDEDPVTGSAHCFLGPYWGAKLGKTELLGRQLSARGGTVGVRMAGDRVFLTGRAITVFRLELLVE